MVACCDSSGVLVFTGCRDCIEGFLEAFMFAFSSENKAVSIASRKEKTAALGHRIGRLWFDQGKRGRDLWRIGVGELAAPA